MMLAHVLATNKSVVEVVSLTSLASEMMDFVERRQADVICVSATPPGAMIHARYLCKQLRRRFPNVKLVVGLWDMQGDVTKTSERIGCGAIVTTTLADAQEQIRVLSPQFVPPNVQQVPPERRENAGDSQHISPSARGSTTGAASRKLPEGK